MNTADFDENLLSKLAVGDAASVETIYRENYGIIESYIIKNSGNLDDARDIFQEAMIVLYEKAKRGELKLTCQLKTYIYAICKRLWLKKLQHLDRFYPAIENSEDAPAADEEMEMYEKKTFDIAIMESAMNKIGEPCKSLLEAFYIQNKTMPQIAGLFGYTNADNAKNQKYKCLVRLKKLFFAQYKTTI
ncbi:MAG: hypothetical protein NVSMB45_11570 [Ginsengibacter sp.]